jgi:membrane protein YdbS with pleckstrin-like domain
VSDGARPEPEGRLAPAARVVWTLEILAFGLVADVIAFAVRGVLTDQDGLLHAIGEVGPFVLLVAVLAGAAVVPALRTRRWRWRLDEQELDLRHGVLTDVRTIVPVARIQHVDVRRSLWAQLAGVAAVVVHTAAGTTEIPVLTEAEAADVRDRLAGLIRTPDDD